MRSHLHLAIVDERLGNMEEAKIHYRYIIEHGDPEKEKDVYLEAKSRLEAIIKRENQGIKG